MFELIDQFASGETTSLEHARPDGGSLNAEALFDWLAQHLVKEGRYHDLFDARVVASRLALGLSPDRGESIDALEEPIASQLEQATVNACQEVGSLLADAGRFREAWMYLRPAGKKDHLHDVLARTTADDQNIEELIEVALYELVAPARGLAWLLKRSGTCNAITTYEGIVGNLSNEEQAECAGVLLRHLYGELVENVRAHISRHDESEAPRGTLTELLTGRAWLFENESYHIDASHLAAVVRFSRSLQEPSQLQQALELSEYGLNLAAPLRYEGDPPFTDNYHSHCLYYRALLGDEVDTAVDYFYQQLAQIDLSTMGTQPLETLLRFLERLGRASEALEAVANYLPTDAALSRGAPTLIELAEASGDWQQFRQIALQRNDPIGYAIARLHADDGIAEGDSTEGDS